MDRVLMSGIPTGLGFQIVKRVTKAGRREELTECYKRQTNSVAHQTNVLAAKPEDQSSNPRTHIVEETPFPQVVLSLHQTPEPIQ